MAVKKAGPKPVAKPVVKKAPVSKPKPKAKSAARPHMPGFSDSEIAYGRMMASANTLIKNRKK